MADEKVEVNAQTVDGSTSASVDLTLEEGKQAQADTGPSADTFGVTPEQFDKYYDSKTGDYNWQAHAKEQEFIVQQRSQKAEPAQEANKAEEAPQGEQEAKAAVEGAGLDWETLGAKIAEDGDLATTDYDALREIGIPETIVKEYIEAIQSRAQSHLDTIVNAFGGEDQFETVKAFAQDTYTPTELEALEKQLADPSQYQLAVDVLQNKMAGAGTPVVHGPNASSSSTTALQPYSSQSEMVADQADPRYKTDSAFRERVYARARVSTFSTNPRAHTGGL